MQKNVSSQKVIVFAFDATTNLPKSGDAANITAYISKDFGSVTALTDTSATEMDATNAKGYYLFDITQTETNADIILVSAKSSTANVVVVGAPASVFTSPANFTTTAIDGSGRVDIGKILGTASAGVAGKVGLDFTAVTVPTTGSSPALAWVESGTLQSATSTTAVLRAATNFTSDSRPVGMTLYIDGGTGAGQSRIITGYVNSTDTATVDTWTTTPDGTSTYKMYPSAPGSATSPAPANVLQWNSGTVPTPNVTGVPLVDLKYTLGTLSAGAAGYIGPDWGHVNAPTTTVGLTNTTVGTLTTYTGNTPQTGDAYARLGAPAGASVSADIASAYARLGAPAGASVSADIASVKTDSGVLTNANQVETSLSLTGALRLTVAALAGKASGLATSTAVFRNVGDTKNRISATVDADGNRSAVSTDAT